MDETKELQLSITKINNNKIETVRKGTPFWMITSKAKIPTVILKCPVTFPPDKIYGKMLSGMGVPDLIGTQGTFTFYTSEPDTQEKYTGRKVIKVNKDPVIKSFIIGPGKSDIKGKRKNIKIPFKIFFSKNSGRVDIELNDEKFSLKKKEWSPWKEISFQIGPFKKMKGILKFYLIETEPELKLYVGPINFDPRSPYFPISYPSGYSEDISKALGLYYTQGMPMDTWAVNEKILSEDALLEQANSVLNETEKMLNHELNQLKKGLLFCYFQSSDIIQHMFWRYIDPKHPLHEKDAPARYKDMIYQWYEKLDKILGNVLKEIGSSDTLIVLSDHGFDSFRRAVHINTWLRKNGFLFLMDPGAKSGRELLHDIDWLKTKAYAIGFGGIYINRLGREPKGIVNPGKETEKIKHEIIAKIKKWKDDKSNAAVINNVYTREEIFWGPYADQTPDIYLGFNIGYRASWQTALGAVPEILIEDNLKKWSGSHLFDPVLIPGIIFANKKITKDDPSIYDIVPTILKTIGLADEKIKHMKLDGTSLWEIK